MGKKLQEDGFPNWIDWLQASDRRRRPFLDEIDDPCVFSICGGKGGVGDFKFGFG